MKSTQHEAGRKKNLDPLDEEVFVNLTRTAGDLSASFAELFKSHGLSEATYNILRILRDSIPGFVPALGGAAGTGPGTGFGAVLGHSSAPAPGSASARHMSGRSCGHIGDQLVARVPDVTRLIDRLEHAGLVTRRRTLADRRLVLVEITPKGVDVVAALDKPVADLHRSQFAHMSRSDMKELNRLLRQVRSHPGHDVS